MDPNINSCSERAYLYVVCLLLSYLPVQEDHAEQNQAGPGRL